MKSYTDIEQSKKLSAILSPKSADMSWILVNYGDEAGSRHEPSLATYKTGSFFRDRIFPKDHTIPCWSLSALLSVLSLPDLIQDKADGELFWQCSVYDEDGTLLCETYDNNPIDTCVAMIEKLYELKML